MVIVTRQCINTVSRVRTTKKPFFLEMTLCERYGAVEAIIRASVDALCRDGPDQISRERVQRGRLTRQGTTS